MTNTLYATPSPGSGSNAMPLFNASSALEVPRALALMHWPAGDLSAFVVDGITKFSALDFITKR